MNDVRFALRALRRSPGFALVAILTLALGIGANTTVFSAVYAVLLAKPPFAQPERLRVLLPTLRDPQGTLDSMRYWSYPEYEAFRTAVGDLPVAAYTQDARPYNLGGLDAPQRVQGETVSATYFSVLGVAASLGRTFAPDEDRTPSTHPVAVISDALWRTAFGADPAILGRTITLNTVPLAVIGVMPAGFSGISGAADVWVPMMMAPTLTFANRLNGTLSFWHGVIARVAPGTDARAAAQLAAGIRAVAQRIPFAQSLGADLVGVTSIPLLEARVDRPLGHALFVLLAAVACVLLIACVNVANLLLARGVARTRELGIRVALGVGRRRLLRQLMAESLVLAGLGGVAAVLVAEVGLSLLGWLRPPALEGSVGLSAMTLNRAVLGFNFGIALVAGLAFGIAPAVVAMGTDVRNLVSGTPGMPRRVGPRGALVLAEVALATVLLVGAGLLLKSFARLSATPLGFEPAHVVTAYLNVPRQGYSDERALNLFTQATERLTGAPGVKQIAVANCLPASGGCDHVRMRIRGQPTGSESGREVWMNMVTSPYFASLGIPILSGRGFTPADRADAPRVAIVTQSAAQRYWPGRSPIGERIQLTVGWGPEDDWAQVVGVVGDVKMHALQAQPQPGVYLSYLQYAYRSNYLVLRSAGDPGRLVGPLRSVVHDVDPGLPLWDVKTMDQRVADLVARDRFSTVLLALFGSLALSLAAVGIYGVVAYGVATRRRELGVRIAIGASRQAVLTVVLRDVLRFTVGGLGVGLGAALALSRLLRSQLYDVSPFDPLAFATAALILVVASGLAGYVPGRRSARVDPMEALRHE
jgi:putative ABC transport system permease protein